MSHHNTLYKQTIYFSIIPFTSMLFLPIAESYKNGTEALLVFVSQHISKISYSMYLINLALRVAQIIDKNFTPNGGAQVLLNIYCTGLQLF